MKLIQNPYEELGNAVVLLAVEDWRDAVKKLKRNRQNVLATSMKNECEKFFTSPHFNAFTGLDGKALLSMLEREVSE